MRQWTLVTHRDFPIWRISRRIISRRKLRGGLIGWTVELPSQVEKLPAEVDVAVLVGPAEHELDEAA